MLTALESLLQWVRKLKLYITVGGAVAAGLGAAIVQMTRDLMLSLARAGDNFTNRLAESGLVAVLVVAGVGIAVMNSFFKHDGEPKLPEIPVYIAVGAAAIAGFFWLIPAAAHAIAVEILSPTLTVLASFLNGEATISIKLLFKFLFFIYLLSFLIDALVQHYIKKNDPSEALEEMARKYWKEILSVLHDIWDAVIFLPKLVFKATLGKAED